MRNRIEFISFQETQKRIRGARLRNFININAPDPILIHACRHYLATIERGHGRAIAHWFWDRIAEWSEIRYYSVRVLWFQHVRRLPLAEAIDRAFNMRPDEIEHEHDGTVN